MYKFYLRLEGLSGVNCQLSNGLKCLNRQPSKKIYFFTVNRQKCRVILIVKKVIGINQISLSHLIFTDV